MSLRLDHTHAPACASHPLQCTVCICITTSKQNNHNVVGQI